MVIELHKKMKCVAVLCSLLSLFVGSVAWAQTVPKGSKPTVGINTIAVAATLKQAIARQGVDKTQSLGRVVESMEQQLTDRLHNTRKFQIIARADLKGVLNEADLQSVISNPSDRNVARAFQIAGCSYVLIVTFDDFQDLKQVLKDDEGSVLAVKRQVRLSAVSKIYNATSGALLETANYQLDNQQGGEVFEGAVADGASSDQLLTAMARKMAQQVSQRFVDVIYPAKVLAKAGQLVSINRGDGTGIKVGQVWHVYALGEALVDEDTGEVLGQNEMLIGKIKIVRVLPKFSQGQIVEDYGVAKSQIVRYEPK